MKLVTPVNRIFWHKFHLSKITKKNHDIPDIQIHQKTAGKENLRQTQF